MLNRLKSHLYALQLLEYNPNKFLGWVLENPGFFPKEVKGRLGWSSKARFLFSFSLLLHLIIPLASGLLFLIGKRDAAFYSFAIAAFLLTFLILSSTPMVTLLASLLIFSPFEYLYRKYLIFNASQKLKNLKSLKVIGITGSYGKTTVKHLLAQLLGVKYKTVSTPESYNKIVSVAKTIISQVSKDTEILIVEMGAYKKGEISEICKMVKPKIGIITGITIQHLESFKSLETVKKAKYELIESLPPNGFAVFNLDSGGSKSLYEKCSLNKTGYTLTGLPIEILKENTYFELFGQKVRTTLLGKHNILNILAASRVAKYLEMEDSEITTRIPFLAPAPHRLELIRGENESLIIDDAFSSNVEGVRAAFNLVKAYQNYPKILVTPGLVELGAKQSVENYSLAREASSVFDYAVVVNFTNRQTLVRGFTDHGWTVYNPIKDSDEGRWTVAYKGLAKDKIVFVADDLNIATRSIFPKISRAASLILLENDLPDIYR